MNRHPRAFIAVAAGVLLVSACGDSDDGGAADETSLASMLQRIPDRADNRASVYYSNLAAIRDEVGAEPTKDLTADVKQLNKAGIQSYFVAEPFRVRLMLIERAEFGFHVPDIDASIQSGSPPDDISLFAGRLDGEEIEQALRTFEPWADELQQGEDGDLTTYAFGEEGRNSLDLITPGRQIGQRLRIGFADQVAWFAKSDAALEDVAEIVNDDSGSLADVDGVAETAEALDDAGAHTAALSAEPGDWAFDPGILVRQGRLDEETADRVLEEFEATALAPWDVAALGEAFADENGQDNGDEAPQTGPGGDPLGNIDMVIVLWHADEADAEENADQLATLLTEGKSFVTGQEWSERCPDPQVEQDGHLVTARCTGVDAGVSLNVFSQRDLLTHR